MARQILVILALSLGSCTTIMNMVYDGKRHGLDCHEMPTLEEVKLVVQDHQDVVENIDKLHGYASVQPDPRCPKKGYVDIRYPGSETRIVIQGMLVNGTFFGVPVDLMNW